VKRNHASHDTLQAFSFATLYRMTNRHDSQWRIRSCKNTFRKMCFRIRILCLPFRGLFLCSCTIYDIFL